MKTENIVNLEVVFMNGKARSFLAVESFTTQDGELEIIKTGGATTFTVAASQWVSVEEL